MRALRLDAIEVIGWVSLAVVVALYFADRGLSGWTTAAGALKNAGILAGLVATDLMCLTLLLAARIPFVDKAMGHDRALGKHGDLGTWVLSAVLVHGTFLTLAYALGDQTPVWTEFVDLLGFGDYALAVIAGALLLGVAVTSIFLSIKKHLPHELWWGVHLLTYVAVALSIPHQFTMSDMFATGWARAYWIGLYCVSGFALLAFRVLLPLFSSLEHRLVVTSVRHEAPDCVSITMTGKNLHKLDAKAGQFFHWRFLAPGLWWHQHPFSISAAPNGALRITVRSLGKGTAQLMDVKPGTSVFIEGPYGIFSDAARTKDAVVLLGSGVGIAPVRAVLEETETVPGRSLVVLRASTPDGLYLYDEFAMLCAQRGVQLVTLIGRRGSGWTPASHDGLRLADLAPWVADADVFVCGPEAWTDAVLADAQAAGVPSSQIHAERFTW